VIVPAGTASRAQPTLRIEQEHARRDDPFACLETAPDLDAIRQLHAERHRAGFEAIARGDEHVLLDAGVDDGVTRHGDHRLSGRFKGRRAIKAWPEPSAGIGGGETNPQRARAVGQRRIQEIDPCRERRTT
jgi:hypothetical protein